VLLVVIPFRMEIVAGCMAAFVIFSLAPVLLYNYPLTN
jgi:hypothetical protein